MHKYYLNVFPSFSTAGTILSLFLVEYEYYSRNLGRSVDFVCFHDNVAIITGNYSSGQMLIEAIFLYKAISQKKGYVIRLLFLRSTFNIIF